MSSKSVGKEHSIERKDFRHMKSDTRFPSKHRADRKKWCKGKVGTEHKLICCKYIDVKQFPVEKVSDDCIINRNNWRILICSVCGKELDFWYPINWGTTPIQKRKEHKKPDWVVD